MTALKRLTDWMNAGQFDRMLDGLVGLLEQDLGGRLPGNPEGNWALSDADARLLLSLLSPLTLSAFARLGSRHVPVLWTAAVRMALQRVQEVQTAGPSSAPPGVSEPGACIPAHFRS